MGHMGTGELQNAFPSQRVFKWLLTHHALASSERSLSPGMSSVYVDHPGRIKDLGRGATMHFVGCRSGWSIAFHTFSRRLFLSGARATREAFGKDGEMERMIVLADRRD